MLSNYFQFGRVSPGLLSLLLVFVLGTCVRAQKPVMLGESYIVSSDSLGEDRVVNVLLPREYQDSTKKDYPVIYLLDGGVEEDFFHVAGLIRYFADHNMMPPAILVGIANVDRKRDFTYPSTDPRDRRDFPTTGGSAKFVGFVQQELIQWVDQQFRTSPHRTLVGQSLGGLLATEVLLSYPGSFQDYIIVSPSLWWDKAGLKQRFQSLHDQLTVVPERLFVAVGEEYPIMVEGARQLAQVFWEEGADTEAIYRHLPNEDHNTILHEAMYQALDHFYDKPVDRRYRFANKWDGLDLRIAPSVDSAVVGKLAYGQELGLVRARPQVPGEVDGIAGHWTFIGSDAGIGWVFDAYLSPVRVFQADVELSSYAYLHLDYAGDVSYETPETGDAWVEYFIQYDVAGNQFVRHDMHVDWIEELRIANITAGQAQVISTNFLLAQGIAQGEIPTLLEQYGIKLANAEGEIPEQANLYFTYLEEGEILSIYIITPKQK